MTRTDTLKRETESDFERLRPEVQKVLKRAAKRGVANITATQALEVGRDWIMVGGKQVVIDFGTGRAFSL